MEKGLFRKSSLERISSPEQLTDYIRVTNPSVWIVLTALAVLLCAVLVWSALGVLTDTLRLNVLVRGGAAVCYVDDGAAKKLAVGMEVRLGDAGGTVEEVSALPISAQALRAGLPDDYTFSRLSAGEWNHEVKLGVSGVPDGLYEAQIILESIRPIAFLWN